MYLLARRLVFSMPITEGDAAIKQKVGPAMARPTGAVSPATYNHFPPVLMNLIHGSDVFCFPTVSEPEEHIEISREFKENVVEPILKV